MADADMQTRRVSYVDLVVKSAAERAALHACLDAVLDHGQFVGGAEVEALEVSLARKCGTAHAIAVNSGTDALTLALRALEIGPGDEVITPPNSFVASAAAIANVGARPVFADVQPDQNIDPAAIKNVISARTRAIMPVHLTGRIADMPAINAIADEHRLAVVEDAAQAMGSRYDGAPSGSLGTIGCFSAHPLKNLNALGDAGFVTTSDDALANRIRRLRNHGLVDRDTVAEWGVVSRMDAFQAAVLMVRLEELDDVIARRRANVAAYRERLDPERIFIPPCRNEEFNSFHTLVAQTDRRDELKAYLSERGVETGIHYAVPIHLQPPARELGYKVGDCPVAERQAQRILTLPIHQHLTADDIAYVSDCVMEFLT